MNTWVRLADWSSLPSPTDVGLLSQVQSPIIWEPLQLGLQEPAKLNQPKIWLRDWQEYA